MVTFAGGGMDFFVPTSAFLPVAGFLASAFSFCFGSGTGAGTKSAFGSMGIEDSSLTANLSAKSGGIPNSFSLGTE